MNFDLENRKLVFILVTAADRVKRTIFWDYSPKHWFYREKSVRRSPDDLSPSKQEVDAYLDNRRR